MPQSRFLLNQCSNSCLLGAFISVQKDDEDDEDGLCSALNLDRCSGRELSCGALPGVPEAPHPVPSVLLTFEGSRLAGT